MILTTLGLAFIAVALFLQVGSAVLVAIRVRRGGFRKKVAHAPLVSLLRPVRGVENNIAEMIETSFQLGYPNLELIFCVDDEDDAVVPIVRALIAKYPAHGAQLLVGRDQVTGNPKLNNLWKGYQAARADWIILSDSNALLPRDYVEALFERWGRGVGVASHATIAVRPEGFAATMECAFMNSYQARWVLAGDSIGRGYALGKTLMWNRETLAAAGGYAAMGLEAAEDIATTRALRRAGLKARLAREPLPQAIGRRRWADVWRRQRRWSQVRRSGLKLVYAQEPVTTHAVVLAVAVALAATGGASWWLPAGVVVVWYAAEFAFLRAVGWPMPAGLLPAMVLRDLLVPVLWVLGWTGRQFDWRGNAISLGRRK